MYFVLIYKTLEDYLERRGAYRNEHLSLAKKAYDDGKLIMAGAFAEPADGALLLFKDNSPKAAEDFAKNDPYVKHGLISEWSVRPWAVVIGGE